MITFFHTRAGHYLILLSVCGLLFFPNLGAHSLWDVDESHNAECAREMLEAGSWCVPTFNFTLRTDKPVLQYWLIMVAYQVLGVSEFAARCWSAIAGIGSVLVTYSLARRMFDPATGLLAGIVLASSLMFCISSHAVTPDALLIFLTLCTFCVFWHGYSAGTKNWLLWIGVTMGLAVLAKGAVGLVLPATAIGLFLLWERKLRILVDQRFLRGLALFALVTLPWYIMVGVETKYAFWKGFFLKHHVERFQAPMEGHGGFFLFHPLVFLVTFAPWSSFLALTLWFGTGRRARDDARQPSAETLTTMSPYRFLWVWLLLWMVFFSIAGTKLPNYVLPTFPAFAILTARFLIRWSRFELQLQAYWMRLGLGCVALVGVVVGVGLALASGLIPLAALEARALPDLGYLAFAGVIPLGTAIGAFLWLRADRREMLIGTLAMGAVAFVGFLGAFGPVVLDRHKVPLRFGTAIALDQVKPEVDIACFEFYQPGLVFYTQRQVERLQRPVEAAQWLHRPRESYLVIPAGEWEQLRTDIEIPVREVARHRDYQSGKEIVLVSNRPWLAGVDESSSGYQAARSRNGGNDAKPTQ